MAVPAATLYTQPLENIVKKMKSAELAGSERRAISQTRGRAVGLFARWHWVQDPKYE
jgi:hypothetical protein